jgi:hypothetical protein
MNYTTPLNRERLYRLWAYLSTCLEPPTYKQVKQDVKGYSSTSLVGYDVRALVDLGYVEHPHKGCNAIHVTVKAGFLDAMGNQLPPPVQEDERLNALLDAMALRISQRQTPESDAIDGIGAYTR